MMAAKRVNRMDANDVAAQKHWDAMATQQMMCGLSDDPDQFRERPLSGILRHAQREWERSRGGDGGMDYLSVPF
jgi:hypothetical protein